MVCVLLVVNGRFVRCVVEKLCVVFFGKIYVDLCVAKSDCFMGNRNVCWLFMNTKIIIIVDWI